MEESSLIQCRKLVANYNVQNMNKPPVVDKSNILIIIYTENKVLSIKNICLMEFRNIKFEVIQFFE